MTSHLRRLTGLFLLMLGTLPGVPFRAGHLALLPFQAESSPTPTPSPLTPADIINAVNNLRLTNGLNALSAHPVLMEVASQQADALAASQGTIGHERPCGMTLGQQLLSMGFPLWGDLSLDGYRSENWVAASTVEEVMTFWLGDAEHSNTMLSGFRSDIGAAVAFSDQIYVVLETALRTNSGQMQSPAYAILTDIPVTQAACMGQFTPNSDGIISQYSIPIAVSTAKPDGDVVHEVRYGQTLWSLAIQYKVSVQEIKRLNGLTADTIIPGWKLLIQKSATQPALVTQILPARDMTEQRDLRATPSSTPTHFMTATSTPIILGQFARQNNMVIAAFLLSFSILFAGMISWVRKKPQG